MDFSDFFTSSTYQDAPWLSDQLLLPNLASGNNLYMVSAFCPSYVFKLARDLASSPEVEPGLWSLVFYVPGDLSLKTEAIARFKSYLSKYAKSQSEVATFVKDCMQLIREGGLYLNVAHTASKRAFTKGCIGVITSPDENEKFVSFVDAKGGDFNSPVKPLLSWKDEDFFSSREVFDRVLTTTNGQRPGQRMVSSDEVFDWLAYIDEWFDSENSSDDGDDDEDLDFSDAQEIDIDLLDFLKNLGDFDDDQDYEWLSTDSEDDAFNISDYAGYVTVVESSEAIRGHIPPISVAIRDLYGPAAAICICGARFIRAYGCDEVSWDGYQDEVDE